MRVVRGVVGCQQHLQGVGLTSALEYFILGEQWQHSLLECVVSGNGIVLRRCMENASCALRLSELEKRVRAIYHVV